MLTSPQQDGWQIKPILQPFLSGTEAKCEFVSREIRLPFSTFNYSVLFFSFCVSDRGVGVWDQLQLGTPSAPIRSLDSHTVSVLALLQGRQGQFNAHIPKILAYGKKTQWNNIQLSLTVELMRRKTFSIKYLDIQSNMDNKWELKVTILAFEFNLWIVFPPPVPLTF